jgi:membrane-bound lytic murein transglycosylase D
MTLVAGLERTSYLATATGATVQTTAHTDATVDLTPYLMSAAGGNSEVASSNKSSFSHLDIDRDHAQIDRWVHKLTTSARGDFKQSLDRMDRYAAMITAKLDARSMPRELIYLALIESNFNPTAKSPVKAMGLWQFMAPTAKQFGLKVKGRVDERKNPVRSTDAALTYLTQLHERFGSWYLAAAAYNSGQGTVSKAMRTVLGRTKGTDADFFRILPKLPRETQDYVPKLIASARVGSEPAKYGF